MSGSLDWLSLADKCRSLAVDADDEDLVITLNRLASEYETKAAAYDFLSGAYEKHPASRRAQEAALSVAGGVR